MIKYSVLTTAIVLLALIGLPACQNTADKGDRAVNPLDELPRLSVGIQVSPAMGLVMVAEEKGFFDQAGVDVVIQEFTAGKFALEAFFGGSLDVAVSGEVPVALARLQGQDFRVIVQVVERTINECRVVARNTEGEKNPRAYFLKQKRKLATSFGGGPEFYTYRFLQHYNIPQDRVELVSQKPEEMPAALASGAVDAISIFDPFARIAERLLGDNAVTYADSSLYSELYVASVTPQFLRDRRQDLLHFLRGLDLAADFMADHPEESVAIIANYTKLDEEVVREIYPNFVFRPALNNLFIEYTTAQSEWAIAKGSFPADTPRPDYRAVLDPSLLREIDSSSVRIEN